MNIADVVQLAVQGGFAAVLLLVLYWQRDDRKAEREARVAERAILEAMRDSLVRIEAAERNEAEADRFLRESFGHLLGQITDLVQRWRVADAIHELHNQEQAEVHTMVGDIARATVDRPTGVHRIAEIEKLSRERAVEREELLRQSSPPRRR